MKNEKILASLSDEGCRIVEGLHKGFIGKTVVSFQHPTGVRFEVAIPGNDDKFKPWMTEFEIYNSFDEDETKRSENENKTIEAFRKYIKAWIKELALEDEEEPDLNYTYGQFSDMFQGFYNGHMAALTGKVEVM